MDRHCGVITKQIDYVQNRLHNLIFTLFFNKTTLVAENKPNKPKPYYLIFNERNKVIRLGR